MFFFCRFVRMWSELSELLAQQRVILVYYYYQICQSYKRFYQILSSRYVHKTPQSEKKNRNCFFSYCCRNFPCYLHINRLSFLPVVSSSGVAYSIPSLVHESPGYGDCTLTTSSTRQSQSAPHLHRVVEGCYGYNGRTQVRVA